MIAYTKQERDQINAAWKNLMAYAEVNGRDGPMELGDALGKQRAASGRDMLSVKAQLLGLLVSAGNIETDKLFMYMPQARTFIAYSWHQHGRFKRGEAYSHNGLAWDEVLISAQDANEALRQYLERKNSIEQGVAK